MTFGTKSKKNRKKFVVIRFKAPKKIDLKGRVVNCRSEDPQKMLNQEKSRNFHSCTCMSKKMHHLLKARVTHDIFAQNIAIKRYCNNIAIIFFCVN